MFQNLSLWRFTYLASEKHFIDYSVNFIEIKYQVQFTDIVKIFIKNFYEVVYGLQVAKIIIINIHTYAKVKTRITTVNNFKVTKLKNDKYLLAEIILMVIFNIPLQNLCVWHPSLLLLHEPLQWVFVFHRHQSSYTIWPNESCQHDFVLKWSESFKMIIKLLLIILNNN